MTSQDNLKCKTRKGVFWSAINTFSNQGLTFLFGIVLARLLSPNDYGMIGILMVFISIISIFVDSGFSVALIRKEEKKPEDYDTEFYFNIVVGFVCYLIMFLSAPLIANIYELPLLDPLLKILSIRIILQSFCIVQTAIFSIKLDFRTPSIAAIMSNIITGVLGILLAYKGLGVWALVIQQLLSQLIILSAYWIISDWRPSKRFSRESFNYLFGFGSKILGSSLIQNIYNNIYPLLIGNKFGAGDLGLYSRSSHFAQLPSSNIAQILNNVSFPVLSSVNNDKVKVLSIYLKIYRVSIFVVFPLMIGLAAIARPLIISLIGVKWEGCVVMLQIICFALMWQPISAVNQSILKVVNRPDLLFKLEIIKRPIGIAIIAVSLLGGMIGVCVGTVLIYLIAFVADNICSSIALDIPKKKQFLVAIPYFINSLFMGILVYVVISLISNIYTQLIVGFLVGLFYILLSCKILFNETLMNTIELIKGKSKI